jgi:hypothetical protein
MVAIKTEFDEFGVPEDVLADLQRVSIDALLSYKKLIFDTISDIFT